MTNKIQPHSKAGQIAAFFEANPHEWLTWDDFITKFDLGDIAKARQLVCYMRQRRGVEIENISVLRLKAPELPKSPSPCAPWGPATGARSR